jgi:hypothetical protein
LSLATRTGAPFADAAFREEIERQLKLAADRRTATVAGSLRASAAVDQSR